ncbi:MAG TPA: carbohydrate ABC transporter permease [Aggregatilineales bacterium]|nr:carbohydrate ABC transporter permease [Aggregatilineales bacterium]
MDDYRFRKIGHYTLIYAIVTLFAMFAALPFFQMTIISFKTDADFNNTRTNIPFWFNDPPTTEHVEYLFRETQYTSFILNSLVIGICVVLITLVVATPAAYSLARLAGRFGERLGILIFLVYLIPPTLLFIPMSRVVSFLSLQNSKWALVVVYPTFTIPFCTWLLLGFMKSIPTDIEEQAMVDGYSRFGAMIRVVLPLAVPGLLTVVVFSFMLTLHEYIYALAFTTTSSQKPISVGVTTELIRGDVFFWQSLMASAVLVALPIAIIYNLFMNRFVSGLTMGAVKG